MLQPTRVSSELASQHFFKYLVDDILWDLGRTEWMEKYNVHDLNIEAWAVGVWVKEAGTIISYKDLAATLEEIAYAKSEQLAIKKKGPKLFLVQGSQKPWYAVINHGDYIQCECLLWKQRHKRLRTECPGLFKAMGEKIFCHHTKAVELSLK
ncbi:MAG: hypothetical protein F6K36_22950 [Symploca sp. SIO3C6]|nr:hypothetical protein [Symploca sp. SIO3C6]NEP00868.1 hypothetical protein [Symploca sp. SIO2E9]